ncbi:MAG TPA: amylo-alpha-1,6-glucosidase [Bryobacteraceae bacterium]|nr:amylo-alpha-1,6-glucosidase [Bryobacteraceae bacterium]
MIRFGPEICQNLELAASREWLETNGLGGFASSTVAGMHTRRYHALLTAALGPPLDRVVLLSRLQETLVCRGCRYELSTNRFPGVVHPRGFESLREFRLDPYPVYTWAFADVEIEKSVFLVHGENTVVIEYAVRGPASECRLEVRPLIACRGFHALTQENGALRPRYQEEPGRLAVQPYDAIPPLYLGHDAAAVRPAGDWWRRFEYDRERERGLDYREDLFNPCVLEFAPGPRGRAVLVASTVPHPAAGAAELRERERSRRRRAARPFACREPFVRALAAAADQFLIRREGGAGVIAGYPWFGEWGRDTMVSLAGLTLATGRVEQARSILLDYARHVDQGMLPNVLPGQFNSVDASLWFFEAVRQFLQFTGDSAWVRANLLETLAGMIGHHERGTRYGIRLDEDGLLAAGVTGVQLTWMDAKVGEWVVTPRAGKPVEVQALWYNALRVMERLAGSSGACYGEMAGRAAASFNRQFWNEDAGCLYDVVDGPSRDPSIRPNQVLAASLPFTMLSREKAERVLKVVRRELLTPYGLRTLSPRDPRYRGRYEGDQVSRDAAYHQGTVWPWLLGPFLTAWINLYGRDDAVRRQVRQWLAPLQEHLEQAGLGQISEIFDGDEPHHPRGCIAQAWSVAELLRAALLL